MTSRRSRPSTRHTNTDLVLGTVLGFFLGVVVMFLLGAFLPAQSWLGAVAEFVGVIVGTAAGGAVMHTRVANRKERNAEHRGSALGNGKCPACGYDLRGTVEPRCPECGERFSKGEWPLKR